MRGFALTATLLVAFASCDRSNLGASCSSQGDCGGGLQCFAGVCAHRCDTPFDCGDGYLCEEGQCSAVLSAIGDACASELECGPGQSCRLGETIDERGAIDGSCQLELSGFGAGAACMGDGDCRSGICSIGHCTQLCDGDDQCPLDLACVELPRALATADASFRGCLQREGVLRASIALGLPYQEIDIEVPGHARSMAIVARAQTTQRVGIATLLDPSGNLVYALTEDPELASPELIRYTPAPSSSTMVIPNAPQFDLTPGIYRAEVGSLDENGGVGVAVPTLEVLYKLDDSAILDLHFYFLNLEEHPCHPQGTLAAETAAASEEFQDHFISPIRGAFADAGLEIGEISYTNILDRPDLDGVARGAIGELASIADGRPGLHLFFARHIDPVGIQAVATGMPGPPRTGGTRSSAVAIGLDTLCYRDWDRLARATAHAGAKQMGLFDSVAPRGLGDPIADSNDKTDNLLHYNEFGGFEISDGQAYVLQQWPGLR